MTHEAPGDVNKISDDVRAASSTPSKSTLDASLVLPLTLEKSLI